MLESKLQLKILKHLDTNPFMFTVKIITANRAGVPDILLCYKGKFIALELKQQNKPLSALQAIKFKQITRAGGIAVRIDSWESFLKWYNGL